MTSDTGARATTALNVVLCSNDAGVSQAAVVAQSALANADDPERLRLWVLSDGISETNARFLKSLCASFPGATLEVVDISGVLREHAWFSKRTRPGARQWPMATWGRIFIAQVLPDLSGKVLYLDIDTLVCVDLGTIFETDLRGNVLGVVYESYLPETRDDSQPSPKYPPEVRAYFNSGVLLIDLDAWRRERCFEQIVAYLKREEICLDFSDQDTLNAVLGTRALALHPRWNWNDRWTARTAWLSLRRKTWRTWSLVTMHEAAIEPAILHFWGRDRPWRCNHRPEGRRYAKVLQAVFPGQRGHLPGRTAKRTLQGAFYAVYHPFVRGLLRLRLAWLRAHAPEWQPEEAPPNREKPRRVFVMTKCEEGSRHEMFDGVEFVWNDFSALETCDWVVVYDEMGRDRLATPQRGKTVLVTVEPPTIKLYPPAYTRQFAAVLTSHPHPFIRHPGKFLLNGALLPFYRPSSAPPPRTKALSTVCSDKAQRHTQHHNRLCLTKALAKLLPEMAWFGHGVRPIAQKAEALEPFRYTIAVENHFAPHHWTEKPTDALAAGCFLFYAGAPDFGDHFPHEAFRAIPVDDPARAAAIIRDAIAEDAYGKGQAAIAEAQRLIRERYNFHARVLHAITHTPEGALLCASRTRVLKSRHAVRRTLQGLSSELRQLARCLFARFLS